MPDERVETAIIKWAPRFTSQGVDDNDFFSPPRAFINGRNGAASGLRLVMFIMSLQ